MTVLRPSIKGQKVSGGPVPGTSAPFPKQLEYSSHLLAYEITHSYNTTTAYPGVTLSFCDGPHFVYGVFFSLNKSTSYLSLCLSLNSFCDEASRT